MRQSGKTFGLSVSPIIFQRMRLSSKRKCWILRNCGNSHAVGGVVDGCHIPIKCPKGGAEARKEYYNFKKNYSIVLMALVDAKYRFMWESCGFPGNSHDSIIFQSTSLWEKVQQGTAIPNIGKIIDGV